MSRCVRSATAVSAPTGADVKRLVRRFASLRAAKRAMASSQLENFIDVLDRYGRPLRERLAALHRDVDAMETETAAGAPLEEERAQRLGCAFTEIEEGLRGLAREVGESAGSISLAQLRSRLPGVAQRHPAEVTALLDCLLEDEGRLTEPAPLIDYLITLLSTEDRAGRLVVVRDPTTLTPRLTALCARLQQERGADSEAPQAAFYAAAEPCGEDADLDVRMRQMRDQKGNLGLDFFIPGVLRSIVAYNAAMSSQIERYVEEYRALERVSGIDEAAGIASRPANTAGERGDAPESERETAFELFRGAVLESGGVRRIAAVVVRQLAGKSLRQRASDRVAGRLELDDFGEAERGWIRAAAAERDGNPDAVIGTAILVGLMAQSLPESTLDLLECGIDPEHLQEHWIPEIDRALKQVIDRRIADNQYDQACALSETRARFLYTPLSARARRDREHRPAAGGSQTAPGAPLSLYDAGLSSDPPRSTTHLASSASSRMRRWGWRPDLSSMRTAAMIGLLLAASANFVRGRETTVHHYSNAERSVLSAHLDSAYRDKNGRGPLFIGKVNDSWLRLEPALRLSESRELIDTLESRGVREVWVFDARNRLQLHATASRIVYPRVGP